MLCFLCNQKIDCSEYRSWKMGDRVIFTHNACMDKETSSFCKVCIANKGECHDYVSRVRGGNGTTGGPVTT